MQIISKSQLNNEVLSNLKEGKIFIYPTDTIYGIGCNALTSSAVEKIRMLKQRDQKTFSVIVPSKEWIEKNCEVSQVAKKWLEKLPGPYTLILKLKNNNSISSEVNVNTETIGVRIPDNWFAREISKINLPFVTTSVNLTGEKPIESLKDLDEKIKNQVDYFIDDGILSGSPSTIVNLLKGKEKIITR